MKPILYWKKSKAEAQLVAGFQSSVCLRKIQRNSADRCDHVFSAMGLQ